MTTDVESLEHGGTYHRVSDGKGVSQIEIFTPSGGEFLAIERLLDGQP